MNIKNHENTKRVRSRAPSCFRRSSYTHFKRKFQASKLKTQIRSYRDLQGVSEGLSTLVFTEFQASKLKTQNRSYREPQAFSEGLSTLILKEISSFKVENTKQVISRSPSRFRSYEAVICEGNFTLISMMMPSFDEAWECRVRGGG